MATSQPEMPSTEMPAAPSQTESNPSPAPAEQSPPAPQSQEATKSKSIHSLVIDTGALIKNEPSVSTLLAQAEELYTTPEVLAEVRDEATRIRVQTTLVPFLKLRSPRPESIKFISGFARRTGDLEVLSRQDIHLLALTYELELERNHGDWRLRKEPGQRGLNGKPPAKEGVQPTEENEPQNTVEKDEADQPQPNVMEEGTDVEAETKEEAVETQLENLSLDITANEGTGGQQIQEEETNASEDDDEDGWITPSNLKKHQAKDKETAGHNQPIQRVLQVAIITSDYAMQNVALRINLNLLAPSNMSRITMLKSWVMRCHGCFTVTKQMNKQFCPSCGQPTLTRTSCSTDAAGNFKLHLKKNFQWNKRGNVYSIPKPTHGTANGRLAAGQGGGKNGWGRDLILAEDQKEYVKKVDQDRRTRYRDLMDEDYLPNLLSGERSGGNNRIKVGAGRTVNSKKRR